MNEETLVFNLSKALEFSTKGEFEETLSLELGPPTMESLDEAYDLSQLVMGAMMDARRFANDEKEEKKDSDEKMGADAVRIIIFSASASIKASDIAKKFKALACKVGTLDGKEKIKESHLIKLSLKDFTDLTCAYIANFTVPSLLSEEEEEGE